MYEFEEDKEESTPVQSSRNWPEILVRATGIILLLVGLWASFQVLLEALRLYRDPVKIEQLAMAIERGSNVDLNLTRVSSSDATESISGTNVSAPNRQGTGQNLRLSYFIAWVIALLILMLVTMIAFSSIRTGGELVLQDRQMKHYMRAIVKELGKINKAG